MDEYLQTALWEKKDNRLKDIVNTIQSEQNDIIRADKGKGSDSPRSSRKWKDYDCFT